MQLGFASAILPDLDLAAVAGLASETGFDCVELMCWPPSRAERRYAGVTHVDVVDLDDEGVARVRETMRNAGVDISALGYYPNPLAPDEAEAEAAVAHLRRVIVAARRLGLDRVNTFVGRDWTKSLGDNWPRFLGTWQPLVAHAEEHGVRIGIENCPMLFTSDEWPGGKNLGTTPAVWRKMFDAIDSPHLGLNYDPSHLVWQMMDYVAPLREFAGKLFHVHAKDARIDRDRLNDVGILGHPNEYHTPKLPGLGDVDWGRFFGVLTEVGYDGPVCVEVEDRAYEGPLERRRASLVQSHTFLRNYVPKTTRAD